MHSSPDDRRSDADFRPVQKKLRKTLAFFRGMCYNITDQSALSEILFGKERQYELD
jgi:hypothetical protein